MPDAPFQVTHNLWTTQSKLFQMNSGIFISEGQALLIDPGMFPDEVAAIKSFVEKQGATVQAIVLTHSHWDHVLGPQWFPGVKVIAQALYPETVRSEQADILETVNGWMIKNNLQSEQPFSIPVPDETFDDTTTLQLGKLSFQLTHAPGHAPDQLTVYEPDSHTLWAADMLSDIEPPIPGQSIVAYRKTLEAISPMNIKALVPGHGMPAIDVLEIRDRIEDDMAYLKKLQTTVESAIEDGKTLEECQAMCAGIEHPGLAENVEAHRSSVERTFLELSSAAQKS